MQVLEFESQYLDALPSGQMYERSYMHRETVTQVVVGAACHLLHLCRGCHISRRTQAAVCACTVCTAQGLSISRHIALQATNSDFFITGSTDGFVKFWKKQPIGVEFVKMYRSHLGPIDGKCLGFRS